MISAMLQAVISYNRTTYSPSFGHMRLRTPGEQIVFYLTWMHHAIVIITELNVRRILYGMHVDCLLK